VSNPPDKHPDSRSKESQQLRLEQLLAASKRLCEAVAADIAALESGQFGELRTTDPEIERVAGFYGREVKALKEQGGVSSVPAPLVAALKESGERLNALLKRHERLVGCMRQAAEGLIQAVADEVEKAREQKAPYSATPKPKRPSSGGAIIYNKVV
jgi:hypothetical protein